MIALRLCFVLLFACITEAIASEINTLNSDHVGSRSHFLRGGYVHRKMASGEEAQREATWSQVRTTFIISLGTMAFLLLVYEVCRRVPLLAEVYDRKRASRPKRTPPPLVTSRGGWFPALLEFLFISLNEDYLEFSSSIAQETNDRRRHSGALSVRSARGVGTDEENSTKGKNEDDEDTSKHPSPSRIRYFCIKPGMSLEWNSSHMFRLFHNAPLTEADEELLRCVGLDSFVMLRFLRFAFDCTLYPFLLACVVLFPTYATNDYDGEFFHSEEEGFGSSTTSGYFSITINKLEPNSPKLWIVFIYTVAYYLFALRRLWLEWEIFIDLRMDFLMNGDPSSLKEDDLESLKQYRNSCLVEYVPETHRRDKEMFAFFDALFPGQVKHAEVLLETRQLNRLMNERQNLLEQYENIYARQTYAERMYLRHLDEDRKDGRELRCGSRKPPKKPQAEHIHVAGERVLALPHLESEIERLNGLVEKEYERIVQEKRKADLVGAEKKTNMKRHRASSTKRKWEDLYKVFMPQELQVATGLTGGACGNGFVEFKTRAAKQAAIQCNLTGKHNSMTMQTAPDPRDIIWENASFGRKGIKLRRLMMEFVLILGILFWSTIITFLADIFNKGAGVLPDGNGTGVNDRKSYLFGLVRGYLPVLLLMLVLVITPAIFKVIGMKIIRFRSLPEVDGFVFLWQMLYRVTNILVIIISGTLWHSAETFGSEPEAVIEDFASGILAQSQFFLNIVFVATGQAAMFQLSQLPSVLFQLMVRVIYKTEALSHRKLEWIKQPKPFIFGRFAPAFIYVFMIAVIYCSMVPLIQGASCVYFFLAEKIYTHQALYVFCQPHEGGGRLMYTINRSLFVTFYVSILVFSTVLGLKKSPLTASLFWVGMTAITVVFDRAIFSFFVEHSRALPLTRARIADEEYKDALETEAGHETQVAGGSSSPISSAKRHVENLRASLHRTKACRKRLSAFGMGIGQPPIGSTTNVAAGSGEIIGGVDYYLYRQPQLNRAAWEVKPQPYRPSDE